MEVLTRFFFAIAFAVATHGHPHHRMLPAPPFNFASNINMNRFQPQNYMYPEVHRGLLEDFFHNLFGRPSFGQNTNNLQNPFDQILSTPNPFGSEATHTTEEAKPPILPDLHPTGSNQDATIIKDGPQNVPDAIHNSNLIQNLPEDLSIEDIEVKPENHITEVPANIIQNNSPGIKEGDQKGIDDKSAFESNQVKLSRVVPNELIDNKTSSLLEVYSPSEKDIGKLSSTDNVKDKKDPGLTKSSDFLLIPITDDLNSRIVFPDSDLPRTPNIIVDSSQIAVSPLSANSAPTVEAPAPIPTVETPVLSTGTTQVPITQPTYQIVNTVPQNQGMLMPVNNIPAPTNSQPVYSILNVPNSSGYQGNPNPQPMYIEGMNSQPNNIGYSNQIYTLVPLNQPNTYVPVNNQPNMVTSSSQPHYIILNNPSNLPPNNQNTPLTNSGGIQYIILGNQPSYVAPVSQPNNVVPLNNQPHNVVPLNSQPMYVTVGNQPNTYIPLDTHTNTIASPSLPNPVATPNTDPSNVVAFSNPDYNLVPLNNANVIQTTSPIILNPIENGNIPILISMKDEADDVSNDKKNDAKEQEANNDKGNVTNSETSTDSNKVSDTNNSSDAIHFPDEQEN